MRQDIFFYGLERVAFEKDNTRGGGTAPPGLKRTEKTRFSAKRRAVSFAPQSAAN